MPLKLALDASPGAPAKDAESDFAMARPMVAALAATASDNSRLALARTFGVELITAWWAEIGLPGGEVGDLRAPPAFPTFELPSAAHALAKGLALSAARLDPEAAGYQIGLIYTSMLPRPYRAKLGVYYTPPALVRRLIERASAAGVNWATCRVLDPACGGGAFLAPVARRILAELPECSPPILLQNIGNRLRGYEIDPFAAWLSQVTLDAVVLPIARQVGKRLPDVVAVCDSLQKAPPRDRFDLVIGNPPYGRVRLDPADRLRFRRSLFGHANLYGLFTDLAIRHAKPGGVIAYVTPTSFLAGEYFKNLRSLLGRHAAPASIDFVSARRGVFDDVLQETLLATYRREGDPTLLEVHRVAPQAGDRLDVEYAGSFPLPDDPSRPWVLPRDPDQADLVEALGQLRHHLSDWGYKVSTGPLVWNRYKPQLVHAAGRNRFPLIWAEAVSADGQFGWKAEKRGHTPFFELRPGDDWLKTNRECVLLQRTTAKEQSRRLIAAALPAAFVAKHGAVVIENHLNMLRPIGERPVVEPGVLAAVLNSAAADRAFRCLNGSVAVSAFELEALPLPAPEALGKVRALVAAGASRAAIDAECNRLYAACC